VVEIRGLLAANLPSLTTGFLLPSRNDNLRLELNINMT